MKKIHFIITIDAPKEKVWRTMLDPEGFKVWTAEFCEGSYYEGSWTKGKSIKFLTPDGDGMTSMIAENKPYEFISIKHVGCIEGGVEDPDSTINKSWEPAFENYTFRVREGATELKVDMDVNSEFEEFMNSAWPKALARLKEICEAS